MQLNKKTQLSMKKVNLNFLKCKILINYFFQVLEDRRTKQLQWQTKQFQLTDAK